MLPLSLRSSLYQQIGPGSLSGQIFADLCDKLLIAEAEERLYKFRCPSDRAGDFKGLDAYAEPGGAGGNFDGCDGKVGFQYKFFPSESAPLSKEQKMAIQNSLESAALRNLDLKAWILITPEDFNSHQEGWFLELGRKLSREKGLKGREISLVHWGQKHLSLLISKWPEAALHLYPDLMPGVRPPTFREMCSSLLVNLGKYPQHSKYHIQLRLADESPVDDAIIDFVNAESSALFCLLGGYGTGKTTALEYAFMQLSRRLLLDISSRIPILIRLRHVRGEGVFRDNLFRYLEVEYGLKLNMAALQSLNSSGRLVLLFDGLDEATGASRRGYGKGILSELYEFLSPVGKLIISSRTEMFGSAVDERVGLLGLQRPHILARAYDSIESLDRRGKIAYMGSLTHIQVKEYFVLRLGAKAESVLSSVSSTYDLQDMATRPVLLDMICETLPHFKEGEEILAADLYERYTLEQLRRDIEAGRTDGAAEQRVREISRVAEYMVINNRYEIESEVIANKILESPPGNNRQEFLVSSFLLRDPNGLYEFSHRSFMEYFAALRMFMDIRAAKLSSSLWKMIAACSNEHLAFLNQIVETSWRDLNSSAQPASAREPVTFRSFRNFMDKAGYVTLSPVVDIFGYAAVSWYDAVAFAVWSRSRIQSVPELTLLIESEFPHGHLPMHEVPRGSLFSVRDSDWKRVILSPRALIFLRGVREWAWPSSQIGDWTAMAMKNGISTFNLRSAHSEIGVFRCVYRANSPPAER